ncbi:MAG: YggT family protein [Gemmatimonadota bacterium]|nr:YggT family protein [Gemmatimonadota bacterium]MDH5805377.1 YggT family protein [Gemmatimonadota bacterium]
MVSEIIRYTVFGLFVGTGLIAIGSWAVRTRRISPFSKTAGWIRRITDPFLEPVEKQLGRRGGNPQQAEAWLVGGVVVGGIVLVSLTGWLESHARILAGAGRAGSGTLIRVLIWYALQIVGVAIMVRVIGSWFGAGRFSKFMKPFYFLTDWLIRPLQKVIPPFGMMDFTPLIAWLLIQVLIGVVIS